MSQMGHNPTDPTIALDAIAKASVLVDEHDMAGLVDMQEQVRTLGHRLLAMDLDPVADCLERAADLVQQVIHREVEDSHAALDLIRAVIAYAQRAVAADQEGRPLAEAGSSPFNTESVASAEQEPIDAELLGSWISSCAGGLAELESEIVAIDGGDQSPELLASIRRRLHTLKGECGVLSLHEAQKICHQAESAIDTCIERHIALPVEGVLMLIDWMRAYSAELAKNPRAAAPDHSVLDSRFGITPVTRIDCAPPTTTACAQGSGMGQATELAPANTAAPAATNSAGDDLTPVSLCADAGMTDTLGEFLCESREHIAGSEQALLELERDPTNLELINTVFRAFHTIKGVAGFLNLEPLVRLAHHAECLLDGARSSRIRLDSGKLNLILGSCDLITVMLNVLGGNGEPPTTGQLQRLVHGLQAATGEQPHGTDAVGTGAAPKAGKTHSVKEAANEGSEYASAAATSESSAQAAVQPSQAPEPEVEAEPAPAAGGAAAGAPTTSNYKRTDQTVKVSTTRMDALVDMVGELVIAQQMVVQDPSVKGIRDQRVSRNLTMVGKIIRDLQAVSMSLRMVAVKATFQKMARLVRDVSAKANRRVAFHTEGEDVEVDRNVVEAIADPLVHMIRNACDHGIEPADVRRASGKPETGTLWLRAFHSGGSIVIEIEDDGKGLDRARIIAKAQEKGLLASDQQHFDMPDSEVFNLIFLPGFSTAERVTDISGRGVGMDVVRRNIEALRGKIDIRSTPGKGTIFSLRLPLTMAIIDGMVVRVGSQRYVVPTLSIEQSFRPATGAINSVVGRGEVASVRGSLLPIYRLNRVLRLDEGTDRIEDGLLIVLESNDSRCCLMVDEILGQHQVVIKSLGRGISSIRGVSGGAILGDGRIALILDVGGIVSEATGHAADNQPPTADEAEPARGVAS